LTHSNAYILCTYVTFESMCMYVSKHLIRYGKDNADSTYMSLSEILDAYSGSVTFFQFS
jgi:hypothetical protein